jgi:hypothetical protein
MGRLVVLRHIEPDANEHFDLLLERDDRPTVERRLLTFRLDRPIDLAEVAEFNATRSPDHRAVYLDYEGPLPAPGRPGSDARGMVERVATGRCTISAETPDFAELSVEIGGRAARFTGERVAGAGDAWRFTRA